MKYKVWESSNGYEGGWTWMGGEGNDDKKRWRMNSVHLDLREKGLSGEETQNHVEATRQKH